MSKQQQETGATAPKAQGWTNEQIDGRISELEGLKPFALNRGAYDLYGKYLDEINTLRELKRLRGSEGDLLEALKEALRVIEELSTKYGIGLGLTKGVIKTAIAKAEGKEAQNA